MTNSFCPCCGSIALTHISDTGLAHCSQCNSIHDPEADYDEHEELFDPYDLADPDDFDAD